MWQTRQTLGGASLDSVRDFALLQPIDDLDDEVARHPDNEEPQHHDHLVEQGHAQRLKSGTHVRF